jgi:hypothetical protein
MSDASMAGIGRALAEALSDFAYTRKPEDQKRVAQLHAELCAENRAEIDQEKLDAANAGAPAP